MVSLLGALMKPADYRHYRIFHKISGLASGLHSTADLAKNCQLPVKRVITQLNAVQRDLAVLCPEQPALLMNSQVIDTRTLIVTAEDYRVYLVHRAIPIAVLRYALCDPHPAMANCCGYYKISRATFYRQFARMDKYLALFDIGLNKSSMQYTGNEQQIRIVLFEIFKLGGGMQDWPTFQVKQAVYQQVLLKYHLSEPSVDFLKLMLNINYWRAIHKHYLPDNPNLQLLCADNGDFDQAALSRILLAKYPAIPSQAIEREAAFSYFVITIIPRYHGPTDPRLIHVLGYFARKQNIVWKFTERLINYFRQQSKERSQIILPQITIGDILIANLTKMVMQEPAIDLLNYQEVLENEPVYQGLYQMIVKFFDNLSVDEYPVFCKNRVQLTTYYYALILPTYLLQVQRPKLRVGVNFIGSQLTYGRIIQALQGVCEIDVHPFKADCSVPDDLVITTTKSVQMPKNVYFLPIDYTQIQMDELHTLMFRLCEQRLTKRFNI